MNAGFNNYLQEKGIDTNDNLTRAFSTFLHSNTEMSALLAQYTDLQTAEFLKTAPTPEDFSKAIYQPPYETKNVKLYGSDYEVTFSHGILADGTDIIKENYCGNGIDPEVFVSKTPLTWGPITYGEVDSCLIHYSGALALEIKQKIDTFAIGSGALQDALWAIACWACPPGTPIFIVQGTISTVNSAYLGTTIDSAYSEQNGLYVGYVSVYINPIFITSVDQSDFRIVTYLGGAWTIAYPIISSYFQDLLATMPLKAIIANEINAWTLKEFVNTFGNQHEFDTWISMNPPTPPENPPTGTSPLKTVTINSYDAYIHQYISLNAGLDNYTVGTTGSSYQITPEEHHFRLPQYTVNDRMFYQYLQDQQQIGIETAVIVEISSNTTIEADYSVQYQVTVNVNGETQYSQYFYNFAQAAVYSDGNYIGVAPGTFTLAGPHTITVHDNTDFYLPTNFEYFDTSNYVTGPSSVTLNAWYWIWTF